MAEKTLIDKMTALKAAGLTDEQALRALSPATPNVVNTSQNLRSQELTNKDLTKTLSKLKKQFRDEPREEIRIPVPYGVQVGGWVKVSINGQPIELPANNKPFKIPRTFKKAFEKRLENLDAMESKAGPIISSENSSELIKAGGLVQGDMTVVTHDFK